MHAIIRAPAAQRGRVPRWGPRGTRGADNARHGRKPRVSEPKLVSTREVFFLGVVTQNTALAQEKKRNGALHRRANQKKFNEMGRWAQLPRPAFCQPSRGKNGRWPN